MSQLVNARNTIKDHPVETAAVVATVLIVGLLISNRSKRQKIERVRRQLRDCNCKPYRPGLFTRIVQFFTHKNHAQIDH